MLPVLVLPLLILLVIPWLIPSIIPRVARGLGLLLHKRTHGKRAIILARAGEEEAKFQEDRKQGASASTVNDDEWEKVEGYEAGTAANGEPGEGDWDGVIGFFHPFCNAGGGGERVLWAAIRATQLRWPKAVCVVYTGDHEADKAMLVERARTRFNIHIHAPTFCPLYLTQRHYVLSSTYPHFTLLGQSLGSILLAYDALNLLVPDIFVDTMGYAFALSFCKFLFPNIPTGAYVHYPTISTDMLTSLSAPSTSSTTDHITGVHAGAGAGMKGTLKKQYWALFAQAYGYVGATIDVVTANSSWTAAHLRAIWGPARVKSGKSASPIILFPPVAVQALTTAIPLSSTSRSKKLVYLAQFRPEKNHIHILRAFARFKDRQTPSAKDARLTLVGSVRESSDDATRVYQLRLLAHELGLRDSVDFVTDASWSQVLDLLGESSVGVNAMWNEHFGIGVVEYQAAGLICVVHDSGGPKEDIVVDVKGGPTGFRASTVDEFADGFDKALGLGEKEADGMRKRARANAKRFREEVFMKGWVGACEELVRLQVKRNSGKTGDNAK